MAEKDDIQKFYICGWCKTKIFYLAQDEPTVPCPECGWSHKSKPYRDVPSEIKIDLTQY